MYGTEAGSWVRLRSSGKGTFVIQRGCRVYVSCPEVPHECWELVLQHVDDRGLAVLHATSKLFVNASSPTQKAILARYLPLSAVFFALRMIEEETGAGSWKTVDAYDVRFKASVGDVVLKAGAANCDQRVAIRNWRTSLEGGGRALHKSKGSAWSDQPWLRMFLRGLRASWSSGLTDVEGGAWQLDCFLNAALHSCALADRLTATAKAFDAKDGVRRVRVAWV